MLTINRPLRPTGIRSYTIKAIKTDSISPVYLYSGSKLNKLEGYLRSSILYTSKEKEIYIINKNLFIIKEETSGVSMKFTELKTSRTRLYALYKKCRPIRKVNKVSARARPARLIDKIHIDIIHLKPKGLNSHSYASIFSCAYSTRKYNKGKEYSPSQIKELTDYLRILLEESTLYTLEQDRRAERSIYTIIEKPEILLAYIHIANLTSTSRVEGKTPFECF
ncbi:uncharacterized protein RAG0_09862 [Rhynchosporium agropyri]|uniref:Uncharacterized protein n=1 Tax=Rhynchosporium agropyri TaxID=914238 RepID=A0A1E1KXB6_9HELO|nr:uncharacterized protein RAG0_09862 [Rhynchosporium agropyri]